MQFTEEKVKKIKATQLYQEQFAKEWGKCVISPLMLPYQIQHFVRLRMAKYEYSALNLKWDAYNKLKNESPLTWDISTIEIAIHFALQVSENEFNRTRSNGTYDTTIEKLVKLHTMISTMFLECEKKCVNMCALTIK